MRSSTRVAALVLAASLAAACNGGDPAGEATAPPIGNPTLAATEPEPSPTPTPTEAESEDWTVPADIDAAYVERVIQRLEENYHEAFVLMRDSDGAAGEPVEKQLRGFVAEDLVSGFLDGLVRLDDADYPGVKPQGQTSARGIQVTDVLTAREDCIYARATVDGGSIMEEQPPATPHYYLLRPAARDEVNPTGWLVDRYFGTDDDQTKDDALRERAACDE